MAEEVTAGVTDISGTVERITYRNQSNSYTVAEVKLPGETVTVVGMLPFLTEGDCAVFYGEYTVHPTYGRQFKAESFERKTPENAAAVLRYLSSGAIRGVGPATAQRIVEKFGTDTLEIIQNRPQELASIKGISLSKAKAISEEYNKQYGVRDIMLMLSKYNVTPDRCLNIFKHFGAQSVDTIKKNPYVLCEEGLDFRFETAEDIAADIDFDKQSELRITAGLEYVLRKNLLNGHTCLPRTKLLEVASRLLECSPDTAENACDRLIECFRIKEKNVMGVEYLSIPAYYSAEEHIAARLLAVKRYIDRSITADALEIDNVERQLGIKFEELQRKAITEAFESGILVLTGGPGTGKTTTLNAIIKLFENRGLEPELAAPTGRAAKRMSELCGMEASTIHRMLGAKMSEDGETVVFGKDEEDKLACDALIIDECSMVDITLMHAILKALKSDCRILLVGDADQLPSVGPGNVFSDIIRSGVVPTVRLTEIFRQKADSRIVRNAHMINRGEHPDFNENSGDFFRLRRMQGGSCVETIVELCKRRLPENMKIPSNQIQVLSPSRKGETGTANLNKCLQAALNPPDESKKEKIFGETVFRTGDRVIQIKNNYDIVWKDKLGKSGMGVYNGDIGTVVEIDTASEYLKVDYEDKVALYGFEMLNELEHAWALTVHKSQGSEYRAVILSLNPVAQMLLTRGVLYTAVTRAKELLIMVGDDNVAHRMIDNHKQSRRYSALRIRLADENT